MAYDTLWCGSEADKLYLTTGFTSTLQDSQSVGGIDTGPSGITWDGTNSLWCGSQGDKLYLMTGFTSTLTDSVDVGGIDNGPNGITWDGTNVLWCGNEADKLYSMAGFTSTLTDSIDVSAIDNVVVGITWDGTNASWCGSEAEKLYLMDGFTSTLQDSKDVSAIDTVSDISWDGVNALWCGNTDKKLYLMDGFTSTLQDSEPVGGIDTNPAGISINDTPVRIGEITLTEAFDLTTSIDSDVMPEVPSVDLSLTTDLSLDFYAGAEITLTEAFDVSNSLDADIQPEVPSVNFSLSLSFDEGLPCDCVTSCILPCTLSLTEPTITTIVYDNLMRVYIFTLTGDADGTTDVNIPISSFQTRIKSGDPSYLSVTIPGIDYLSAINARLNGDLVVRMGYKSGSSIVLSEIVAQVDFSNPPDWDEGSENESVTLSGYRTESYETKSVTISGNVYKSMRNGKLRFRCNPDLYLRPGDTATDGVDSFIVDSITFSVSAGRETYEVAE